MPRAELLSLADFMPDLERHVRCVLQLRSEEERLKQVVAYFATYASRQDQTLFSPAGLHQTNGHAGARWTRMLKGEEESWAQVILTRRRTANRAKPMNAFIW
ncbi:MAG: hypothetical protein U5J83_03995 [Bryobacterales bacterium]|nr:hypothetical protein [Bryobacterales bacterium]